MEYQQLYNPLGQIIEKIESNQSGFIDLKSLQKK